jgi:hypothetical protein
MANEKLRIMTDLPSRPMDALHAPCSGEKVNRRRINTNNYSNLSYQNMTKEENCEATKIQGSGTASLRHLSLRGSSPSTKYL